MKTLIFGILGLLIVLVIGNFVYEKTTLKSDLNKHSEIMSLVNSAVKDNAEIIYLGESSNTSYREDDIDKRAISEMTADYFPNIKFGHLTKQASHAGIFYQLLNNYPRNTSLKTVIVTLNLRSFDAGWIYSDLETGLQKQLVLMENYPPIINRFLLAFKAYDIKTNKERRQQYLYHWKKDYLDVPSGFEFKNVIDWDNGMAKMGVRNDDDSYNYELTELACHYVKTFAFTIDTLTNPRIKDFDKIVELSKSRGWNLVFNLMAENVTQAKNLVGDELLYVMKKNRELLIQRYTSKGALVVDNFDLVQSIDYIDQNWTTEHYAQRGRMLIARNLANQLKKFHNNEFIEPIKKISKYFYDCEGESIWGGKSSITNEQKYSGLKSSKVNQESPYSIVLELSVDSIVNTATKARLKFFYYQDALDHNAKLVFQINGEKIEQYWKGIIISELNSELNKWVELNYTFELPDVFFKGDIMKFYVHSISDKAVYLDDFEVEFIE